MESLKLKVDEVSNDTSLREWYQSSLKGNAAMCCDDYCRLASWFIVINNTLKLSGKYSKNEKNLVTAACYGFSQVDPFLLEIMEQINSEELSNFNVHNLRKFLDKLKPFREYPTNRDAALRSVISKKYKRLTDVHLKLVEELARANNSKTVNDLVKSLNTEFRKRQIQEFSYETLRPLIFNANKKSN